MCDKLLIPPISATGKQKIARGAIALWLRDPRDLYLKSMKGYKHLNREQRYTIAQMYKQGSSLRTIAQTIEVSASTVSRELWCTEKS